MEPGLDRLLTQQARARGQSKAAVAREILITVFHQRGPFSPPLLSEDRERLAGERAKALGLSLSGYLDMLVGLDAEAAATR